MKYHNIHTREEYTISCLSFQNFYYKSVGKAAVKGIVDYFLKIAGLAKAVQSSGQTNM